MTTSHEQNGVIELARDVYARVNLTGTNSGFIVGDDSVLLIDSNRAPSVAREIIGDIKRVTDKPIRYVIDTHHHWDHVFGNQEFPDSVIIGHVNARRELELNGESMRVRVMASQPAFADEYRVMTLRLPELTFESGLTMHFAGRRLELLYFGNAHTRGDIFIYLPEDRILYTGDAIANGRAPAMMDGYIQSWVQVDDKLLALDVEQLAPGHGPIGARPAMAEARAFMATVWDGAERAFKDGKSPEQAYEGLDLSAFGHWPNPDRAQVGVARAYAQLRGELD